MLLPLVLLARLIVALLSLLGLQILLTMMELIAPLDPLGLSGFLNGAESIALPECFSTLQTY